MFETDEALLTLRPKSYTSVLDLSIMKSHLFANCKVLSLLLIS